MPIKVYPPINDVTTVLATRRLYSSANCVNSGASTTPQTSSNISRIERSNATGWEIPGWRKMKNDGAILPFTKWDRFHLSGSCNPAFREWCGSPTGNRNKWENLYAGGPVIDTTASNLMSLVDPIDLQYFVQKAAASIYSSGWDAGTFLAEIGQLRRMLTGVTKKLQNLSQGRSAGELYNLWLEGRYGWRTLMYDIRDLHGVLSSVNENRTRYRQATGSTVSGAFNDYVESTSSGIIAGTSTDITWSGNLRGTVVADIDIPDFQFNPVTTAWEVTRLSFVVDWLLNVGQALEAVSFLLMTKSYQAGGGYRFDFQIDYETHLVGTTGATICYNHSGSAHASAYVIARVPMSVDALPRIKLRLDEYKIIDLLALVLQRLK